MKKIYLLIILLVSTFGFAQGIGKYNVSMNITDIDVKKSISGNCGSRLESWLDYSNPGVAVINRIGCADTMQRPVLSVAWKIMSSRAYIG